MNVVGEISINISLGIYIFYFLPQLIYNQKSKHTDDICLQTQILMLTAGATGLIYGFGFHLEWQYNLVSIIALICITIQHLQITKYNTTKKLFFMHIYTVAIIAISIMLSIHGALNLQTLLVLGYVSNILYCYYWLPQIIQNYKRKHAQGFSYLFLILILFGSICDFISAISFNWPLPSLFGPIIIFILVGAQIAQRVIFEQKLTFSGM